MRLFNLLNLLAINYSLVFTIKRNYVFNNLINDLKTINVEKRATQKTKQEITPECEKLIDDVKDCYIISREYSSNDIEEKDYNEYRSKRCQDLYNSDKSICDEENELGINLINIISKFHCAKDENDKYCPQIKLNISRIGANRTSVQEIC